MGVACIEQRSCVRAVKIVGTKMACMARRVDMVVGRGVQMRGHDAEIGRGQVAGRVGERHCGVIRHFLLLQLGYQVLGRVKVFASVARALAFDKVDAHGH